MYNLFLASIIDVNSQNHGECSLPSDPLNSILILLSSFKL